MIVHAPKFSFGNHLDDWRDVFHSNFYDRLGNSRLSVCSPNGIIWGGSDIAVCSCSLGARGIYPATGSEALIHWPAGEGLEVSLEDGTVEASLSAAELGEYSHTGYSLVSIHKLTYETENRVDVVKMNPVADAPSLNSFVFINFTDWNLNIYEPASPSIPESTDTPIGSVYLFHGRSPRRCSRPGCRACRTSSQR